MKPWTWPLLALPLTGCAAQYMQIAQSECAAMGYEAGSLQFANCVQSQYNQKQAAYQSSMQQLGTAAQAYSAQQAQILESMNSKPSAGKASGPAYLRSQSVQGSTRTCVYDRLGKSVTVTKSVFDTCQLKID